MTCLSRGLLLTVVLAGAAPALLPLPLAAQDGVLSPASARSVLAAFREGASQPEQCPQPDSLSALISAHPEEAAAITAFTVNTLRHASDSRDESPCQCVSELAAALVSADPEHAAETRGMLTDRFPDCTSPVTAALEDTLAASTGPDDAPLQPIMPWRQPSIGENGGKNRCQRNCSPIEPPNSAAVSLTKN
jgi:hypothetical protein